MEAPVSFLAELKQRRVVRVGLVYLVVAWVAVQAASIALPAFDAPTWILRVVILLLALGFPFALLLTWAVDLTPEGVRLASGKVGNKRMVGISLALVALALGWYFYGQPALRKGAGGATERSVAVMPFVNMSGNPANEYFSDGLAETTLDMLAQVPDLKVIARTSSFAFKGKPDDMREIGRKLGAAHLLEGSVQQAGDTVRITVQLIRAKDGSHLWSQRYDRKLADVFRIQDEIATSVVQALEVQLPASAQKRLVAKRTDNVAAYDAYLKGIALLPRRDVAQMREALKHFERAIQLDPTYARAYVGAHDTIHLLDNYGTVSPEERSRGPVYLERALALAPQLGEAHVARGAMLEKTGDLRAAEAEYRRGVALAPGYATGHQWLAELLGSGFGRFDESLPVAERARKLDPLSPVIRGVELFLLGQSGRVDEALAQTNRLIADQPNVARTYDDRAVLHGMQGHLVPALRDVRRTAEIDPKAYGFQVHRCFVLLDFGAVDEADDCVSSVAAKAPDAPSVLTARAVVALQRKDPDAALAYLARIGDSYADDFRSAILLRVGRGAEALAIKRKLVPHLVEGPPEHLYPGEAREAMETGIALMQTGEDAKGRALIRAAIAAVADRPYAAIVAGRGWMESVAYMQLGENDAALASIQRAVDAGHFLGVRALDIDPLLADLRKDPRFAAIIAPARAKAAAQVDEARRAGLL
jgi:TolB-like protein/Flp pilus assembly protein TadD